PIETRRAAAKILTALVCPAGALWPAFAAISRAPVPATRTQGAPPVVQAAPANPGSPLLAAPAPTADAAASVRSAMLRTYIHGVDDAPAEHVLGPDATPELLRLLADPSFPRRDNVVAFLGRRDGGEAATALIGLLSDPPAPLNRPEEDRAILLVPDALGNMA